MAGILSVGMVERLRMVRCAWPGPRIPTISSARAAAGCSHGLDEAYAVRPIRILRTTATSETRFIGVIFLAKFRLRGLYRLRVLGLAMKGRPGVRASHPGHKNRSAARVGPGALGRMRWNKQLPAQPPGSAAIQWPVFGAGSSSLSISCLTAGVAAMPLKTSFAKKNLPSEGTMST